jgi:hypothetical protein
MSSPATDPSPATQRGPHSAAPRPSILPLVLSVSFIFFLVGSAVSEFRCFPYAEFLQPSFTAARALQRQFAMTASLRETDLWHTARHTQRGVVRNQSDKISEGFTLYTSGHDSAAFLIDMQGHVIHHWRVPFHSLWSEPPHVSRPLPESFIHWRRAHLFPNGDLIAMYEAAGDTPWGYGLVKVDRHSEVIWKVAEHVHHDLCVHPDGTVITLTHDWRDARAHPVPNCSHLGAVLLDDFVVVISPDGKITRRISLLTSIANSDYSDLLRTVEEDEWDVLHTNTVERVTPEFAEHHEFARADQIMLSFRSRNALAILDLESERIVWASCGPYRAQHDPDVLPNGQILLFDNRGHAGPGGPSRIIEFDPVAQAIHWSYTGTVEDPLYSLVRSTQQLLPGGNILITESDAGRILEVSRSGEVCWEFRNPARLPEGPPSIAIVCGATRVPAEYVQFPCQHPDDAVLAIKEPKQ